MKITLIVGLILLLVPTSLALIPASNSLDNKSYVAELNTNTIFSPENHEVFESEITPQITPISQNLHNPMLPLDSHSGSGYYDTDGDRNKTEKFVEKKNVIIEPTPESIISDAKNSPQKTDITSTTTQKATGFSGLIGLVALFMIATRQRVRWH